MANGGDVIFNFKGDTSNLSKATKTATSTLKGIGGFAAKTIGGASLAVGTAVAGIAVASVKARGEIEQAIGGTEAVFGKYAENVQEMAKESYSTMGTSANDYMATINKMASLMKGSNIDTQTAMDLSSKAMQRAADVASIMGLDVNTAMESIAGAAKGNFTMMDNLGVAMNATTLQNYALSKGIKKTYKDMSNAEKIQLAMEMFLDKSAYAAGNYAKENETLSGSVNTLKGAWSNFLAGAGSLGDVLGSATDVINSIVKTASDAIPDIMENISDWLPDIMETISGLLMQVLQSMMDYLPDFMYFGIDAIKSLIQGLAQMLPEIIMKGIECIVILFESLIDNIDMLVDAGIEIVLGLADGIVEALPDLIEKVPVIIEKVLNALWNNLPKIFNAGVKLVTKLGGGLIKAIPQLVSKIPQIVGAVVSKFSALGGKFVEVGKNVVKGLWNGITNVRDWLFNKIKGFKDAVLNKFKSFFGIKSPSTLLRDEVGVFMAQGIGEGFTGEMGDVSKQMTKSLGAVGLGDMFEMSPTLNRTTSTSSNVNIQVINNMETDFMGNIVNNIKTFTNGAKNDYNYGMAQ